MNIESLKDWWRENARLGVLLVLTVLIAGAVVGYWWVSREPAPYRAVYFYDPSADKLFVGNGAAPQDERGVRAYVFACGDCATGQHFTGMLVRTEGVKEYMADPRAQQWYEAGTAEARAIEEAMENRCPNTPLRSWGP